MSSYENDPPEFVGRDHSQRADPPKSRKAAPPVAAPKPATGENSLAEELASPVPPVSKPGTHLKFSVVRPAKEYALAQQEVQDAQAEETLAKRALADAELVEVDALNAWQALQEKPDPNRLLHDYANRSTEQRAANVAAGRPAEAPQVSRPANTSPIDRLAAQRSRQAPGMVSNPLRSAVPRRHV